MKKLKSGKIVFEDRDFGVGGDIPNAPGIAGDLLWMVTQERLAIEKEAKELKSRESEIKQYLIDYFEEHKDEGNGAIGKERQTMYEKETHFAVKDWDALWSFIFKNRRTDFVQKRLGEQAAKDYFETEGEVPPGCHRVHVPKISSTKIKGK